MIGVIGASAHMGRMNTSNNAPTVLWDMDNTLFDWSDRFDEILLSIDPSFPIVPLGQRVGFDYFWIPEANPKTILTALNHPDLYDDLDPIPGTIEAFLEMEDAGVITGLCSTPTWTNSYCVQGKLASVTKHLGAEHTKQLILAHDKTFSKATVLIDDKPEITGTQTPEWAHALFDRDYNTHVANPLRMTDPQGWRELFGGLPEFKQHFGTS